MYVHKFTQYDELHMYKFIYRAHFALNLTRNYFASYFCLMYLSITGDDELFQQIHIACMEWNNKWGILTMLYYLVIAISCGSDFIVLWQEHFKS